MKKLPSIYFPSLNGIRALAALSVMVYHIEQVKYRNEVYNFFEFGFVSKLGSLGVTLFFVLSGFLITYLLYRERESSSTVNIKYFYVRRILRIWPLYFFIILVSLGYNLWQDDWNYHYDFFVTRLTLFTFFLSNVCFLLYSHGGFPSQLWSVSSEEQFYLIWPHLIRYRFFDKVKNLIILVVLISTLRGILYYLDAYYDFSFKGIDLYNLGWRFLTLFRVDCMAVGAIGAFVLFNQQRYTKLLTLIYSKNLQVANIICLVVVLSIESNIDIFTNTITAALFAIIIVNAAANSRSIINLENSVFNSLGKISYGIYVYHPLIVTMISNYFLQKGWFMTPVSYVLHSMGIFIVTIIISYLSYVLLESPFLKLKFKYTN